jgi:hypothetical protein
MYKFLIKKDGHTLTGFDDEVEAKNFAAQHKALVVENNVKEG